MENELITILIKEPNKTFKLCNVHKKTISTEIETILKNKAFFVYNVPYVNLIACYTMENFTKSLFNVYFLGQPIYGPLIFVGCSPDGGNIRNINEDDTEIAASTIHQLNVVDF